MERRKVLYKPLPFKLCVDGTITSSSWHHHQSQAQPNDVRFVVSILLSLLKVCGNELQMKEKKRRRRWQKIRIWNGKIHFSTPFFVWFFWFKQLTFVTEDNEREGNGPTISSLNLPLHKSLHNKNVEMNRQKASKWSLASNPKSYTREIESHTQRKRNYIDLYEARERESLDI
jgi:hypothetical protein